MKYKTTIRVFAGVLCTSSFLFGESAFERDFQQLKAQRDKTISTAIEPINRRYIESLGQLLRRATQSNDLDAAFKIKNEMQTLSPSVSGVSSAPKTVPIEPSKTPAKKRLTAADKKLILSYFEDKTWEFSPVGTKGIIAYFKKGGTGLYQTLDGTVFDTLKWNFDDDGSLHVNGIGRHKRVSFTSPTTADVIHQLPDGNVESGLSAHLAERSITK